MFSVSLPLAPKEPFLSIDVLLAVRDKLFTYPAEQALKSSGLKVITFANLEQAMKDAQLYRPTLLVTEALSDDSAVQDLLSTQACWPDAKILLLYSSLMQPNMTQLATMGQQFALTQSYNYLDYPVDLTHFVSTTHRLLAHNG